MRNSNLMKFFQILTISCVAFFIYAFSINAEIKISYTSRDVLDKLEKIREANKNLRPVWEVPCDNDPTKTCFDPRLAYDDGNLPQKDTTLPEATYFLYYKDKDGKSQVKKYLESEITRDPAKYNIVILPLGFHETEFPNLVISVAEKLQTIPPLYYRWEDMEVVAVIFPPMKECGPLTNPAVKAACQIFTQQYYLQKFRFYDDVLITYYDGQILSHELGCVGIGKGEGSMSVSSTNCIPHEFGHVMGLGDEYVYDSTKVERVLGFKEGIDTYSHVVGYPNFASENCLWGHPPFDYWEGYIGKWDYHLGCTLKTNYRTFYDGLMNGRSKYSSTYIRYYNSGITRSIGYKKYSVPNTDLTLDKDSKYIWMDKGEVSFNLTNPKDTAYVEVWINGRLATSDVDITEKGGKVFLDLTTPRIYPNTEIEFKPFNYLGQQGKSDGLIANPLGKLDIKQTGKFEATLDSSVLNIEPSSPTYIWICDTKAEGNPEIIRNENYGYDKKVCKYSKPGDYYTTLKMTSGVKNIYGKYTILEFIIKNKITVLEDGSIKSE